jgi:transposase-like protein
MRRRRFTREFKVETVKLVGERRVSAAQAGPEFRWRRNISSKIATGHRQPP